MKDKLNFEAFIEQVSLESGFDIDTSKNFSHRFFELLAENSVVKKESHIRNFGSFKTVLHPSHLGVNPGTQDPIAIPAYYSLHFYPSKNFSQLVNAAQGYRTMNDLAYDAYLGLKHYIAVAVMAVVMVFSLFFLPQFFSHVSDEQPLDTFRYVTVPHSEMRQSTPEALAASDTTNAVPVSVLPAKEEDPDPSVQTSLQSPVQTVTPELITPSKVDYYQVSTSDSLSEIAKQYYGHAEYWPLIYRANRELLDDPDRIYVGMNLKIPQLTQGYSNSQKHYFAAAYLEVYQSYQSLGKVNSSHWVLWLGLTKLDSCLLENVEQQIRPHDMSAVNRYLACNVSSVAKDLP